MLLGQACFGHTEGAAGITGVLLAVCSLQQSAAAALMCLRNVNPYVGAALQEWHSNGSPLVPREAAAGTAVSCLGRAALAGGSCLHSISLFLLEKLQPAILIFMLSSGLLASYCLLDSAITA